MKVLYLGAGFVGACSAAISANSGHETLVYDVNEARVRALSSRDRDTIEAALFEDGLADLIIRHGDRLRFTNQYDEVIRYMDSCDAVFICVPTPEIAETGESDLTYYFKALEDLSVVLLNRNGGTQEKYLAVVNRSTVPIEALDQARDLLAEKGVKNVGIVSNPEFLVEGKAVSDSLRPDRIVIGAWDQKDFDIMRGVYQRFYDAPDVECIEVNPKEAAAGKLLSNFYLYTKLATCFDIIGRTCETFDGLHFENIRRIIASDNRIGSWGFYNSLYAGGSCLIKDARSLSHQLQTNGQSASLVDEIHASNKRQLETFLGRPAHDLDFDWKGKKVALLGLAFKRYTNDVRNSPSFDIVTFLQEKKVAKIFAYDPCAADNFSSVHPEDGVISYVSHEFEAIKDVDVIIIATDWPQFRGLADVLLTEIKNRPLLMDGRRMLQHRYADLMQAGCDIVAVGSPTYTGNKSK